MKTLKTWLSIPAIFAFILGASIANAQETIDAETRENFLGAYADIMEIQNRYAEMLQTASNEEEAMQLQQAAQEEMQEAVAANDMSVEEYNNVIQTASANPELMAELEAAIEAAMQ